MPVEVSVNGEIRVAEVGVQNSDPTAPMGEVVVELPRQVQEITLDPHGWLLRNKIGYGETLDLNP
jgi:hypothetical protein